jgi:hypothetical protein
MTRLIFACTVATLVSCVPASVAAEPVSFRNEVLAVLSRAGCNSGPCHGNLNGKGGFRLSLRGFEPVFDFNSLTRDMQARRTDPARPNESLILQKATGQVPHEGGIRFSPQSNEFQTLRNWIAAGCPDDFTTAPKLTKLDVAEPSRVLVEPNDRTAIKAIATFSDGSKRDVTTLAAFDASNIGVAHVEKDGTVRREMNGELLVTVRYLDRQSPVRIAFIPNRPVPTFPELSHSLDRLAFERFRELRIRPSELATDEVFLRRVYLDTLGVIPTLAETKSFLNDSRSDKRTALIDSLLSRPEFAEHWAQKWSDLLRNEEKSLDKKGTHVFHHWMKAWFDADKPLTDFAKAILTGSGSTYAEPEANFYRAVRDPYQRAEAVAQVFLGVRVGCARCHNHPFDIWTQDDYHRFAAVFSGIDYRVLSNTRKDDLDKHEFVGEQIVVHSRTKPLPHPRGGKAKAKLLGGDSVPINSLGSLADWVANPDNPFFAKAQANRIWLHLTGKGLVDPNDDFRETNPASHPAVLDHLAMVFAENGYRVKPLVRHILTSRIYQLSSAPNETNVGDEIYHSKATVSPLKAEQLMDALARGLDAKFNYTGYPSGTRAGQVVAMPQTGRRFAKSSGDAERFMRTFGKPERLLTCECERSEDAGMMQAFSLMTGDIVHGLLKQKDNRIGFLMAAPQTDDDRLCDLYLSTLSRMPTKTESDALLKYVTNAKDRRAAWEDVAWGLVNSKEFLLRR